MSEEHDKEVNGYAIADLYLNSEVRAYTAYGAALRGTLKQRRGKYLLISQQGADAILNMDHMTSISRRK